MLDISHVIKMGAFSDTVQLERAAVGDYVDGIWESGSPTLSSHAGSITPATANDLLKLPEGERQKETMRLITQFQLKISKNKAEADIVIYLGHRYRVFGPSEYRGNGFSDVLIQKEDNA